MSTHLKKWKLASLSGRKFLEESKLIPEHNICNIWFLHYFSLPLPASGDRLTWNVAKSTNADFLCLFLNYVLNDNFMFWFLSWVAKQLKLGIDCAVLVCTHKDTFDTYDQILFLFYDCYKLADLVFILFDHEPFFC